MCSSDLSSFCTAKGDVDACLNCLCGGGVLVVKCEMSSAGCFIGVDVDGPVSMLLSSSECVSVTSVSVTVSPVTFLLGAPTLDFLGRPLVLCDRKWAHVVHWLSVSVSVASKSCHKCFVLSMSAARDCLAW